MSRQISMDRTKLNELRKELKIKYDKYYKLPEVRVQSTILKMIGKEELEKFTIPLKQKEDFTGNLLGSSDRINSICGYCNSHGSEIDMLQTDLTSCCPGHYGRIEFPEEAYVYHPQHVDTVAHLLSVICADCGNVAINVNSLDGYDRVPYWKKLSFVAEAFKTKKSKTCFNKKRGEKSNCRDNRIYKTSIDKKKIGKITFKINFQEHPIVAKKAYEILSSVTPEAKTQLGFEKDYDLTSFILTSISVIPNISRQFLDTDDGKRTKHFFTETYSNLLTNLKRKDTSKNIFPILHNLIDSKYSSTDSKGDKRPVWYRLQGKSAIIRKEMLGKRNDQTARTVAGPGSNIDFYEIRIPNVFAKILTKEFRITNLNHSYVKNLYNEGKIVSYTNKDTKERKIILSNNRKFNFKIGDIVERNLIEGDYTMINRQPSLHKYSLLGMKIKVKDENDSSKNIETNISTTTPLNLDYDGDETNLYHPKSFLAICELKYNMTIYNNMLNEQNSSNIIGLVMNSLIAAFLLSDPKRVLEKEEFDYVFNNYFINYPFDMDEYMERLKKYGVELYTGKCLISMIFPSDFNYDKKGVVIREGILIHGRLSKAHLGTTQNSIIQKILLDYPKNEIFDIPIAANFVNKAQYILTTWLDIVGFTVGYDDCKGLDNEEKEKLNEYVQKRLEEIEDLGFYNGNKNHDRELDIKTNKILSEIYSHSLSEATKAFEGNNNVYIMSKEGSGAKGDPFNMSQISGVLGQQYFKNERPVPQINSGERTSVYDDPLDNNPKTRGFVDRSFIQGLTPNQVFLIQYAGREGIINTALTTSKVGDLNRSIGRLLEDARVSYNGGIELTSGVLIIPSYNYGFNAQYMYPTKTVDNFSTYFFTDVEDTIISINSNRGWILEKDYNLIENVEIEEIEEDEINIDQILDELEDEMKNKVDFRDELNFYEKIRLIGIRAEQLNLNAKPKIPFNYIMENNLIDPIDIAEEEFKRGLIDTYMVRKYNDGSIKKVYNKK